MNWIDFLPAARAIVTEEKRIWPRCEGVMCGGGGSSSGNFSRQGDGYHTRYYSVPSDISSLISDNVANASTAPELATQQSALFSRLMQETPQGQPGFASLLSASQLDPTNFAGKSTMESVANKNPYGGSYEADTFGAFQQRASDAMATVGSGPDAVRGGDSRTGIGYGVMGTRLAQERGQEIRQAQQQDVGNVMNASQGLAGVELGRTKLANDAAMGLSNLSSSTAQRGLEAGRALDVNKLNNLQLLQLAASLQGQTVDHQSDNFRGQGDQSGWQGGLSCCFIFNESLNGVLPWYVEAARIDLWTSTRRKGYTWMARWLVPAMRRSKLVRHVVNVVMVKPFLHWGAWIYGETDSIVSAMFAPLCKTWLALWQAIGRRV